VVDANYEALWLPRDARMKIHIGDARNVIDSLKPDVRFDFFFGDVFTDYSVPWHLTTLEFYQKIAGHLTPDGAYLMNIIDDYRTGLFVGACYVTLKQVFKHVYIFCTDRSGVRFQSGTFVVAASNTPIDVSGWRPGHTLPLEGSVLTSENLAELEAKCGHLVLTDDLAPVENLIEPVVRARVR
jgi:spermidine synthase